MHQSVAVAVCCFLAYAWAVAERRKPCARPAIQPRRVDPGVLAVLCAAAKLGRPYAFALQFGDADVGTALRMYRENFQPSEYLAEPYTLVSIGVVAHDDAQEAYRQALTAAMAMLRMFKRESYSLLPPEEVENYVSSLNERQVLEVYTQRFVNGTGEDVAASLDRLYEQTQADEIMLVTMGSLGAVHVRTIELIAQYYGLRAGVVH